MKLLPVTILLLLALLPTESYSANQQIYIVPLSPAEELSLKLNYAIEAAIIAQGMVNVMRKIGEERAKKKREQIARRIQIDGPYYYEKDWLKQASESFNERDILIDLRERLNKCNNVSTGEILRRHYNKLVTYLSTSQSTRPSINDPGNYVERAYLAKCVMNAIDTMNIKDPGPKPTIDEPNKLITVLNVLSGPGSRDPSKIPGTAEYNAIQGEKLSQTGWPQRKVRYETVVALKRDMELAYNYNIHKIHLPGVRAQLEQNTVNKIAYESKQTSRQHLDREMQQTNDAIILFDREKISFIKYDPMHTTQAMLNEVNHYRSQRRSASNYPEKAVWSYLVFLAINEEYKYYDNALRHMDPECAKLLKSKIEVR